MGFKNYLAIVVLFILGNVQNIFAQPSNDACASAIPLTVTNGSCSSILYTNVAATTVGTDPAPACWSPATRSHTVWFSFVATTADIELSTNFAGTLANTQIGVYSGTCGSLTQLACQEDVNTAGGLLHTNVILHGLTIGNTYYVMVDGNGTSTGTFGICAQETLPIAPPSPIQDCDTAQFLCNKNNVSIPNGTGGPGLVQTNPSCFGSPGERASWWYTFTVATSGTLNFTITPNGSVDYDFAVYNVTTGCPGTELVCNWDGTTGATGLCGTGFGCENTITVTAGQTYAILVDRYTSASTFGFVMDFTGTTATFTSPTPSFTASAACLGQATNFTNTTIGSNTYSWNFGDGFTSNLENPSHTYAATGTYNVTLLVTTVPGGCQNQIIIPVTVSPIPTVNAGSDTSTCSGACVSLSGSTNATGYTGPLSLSNTTSYTIPDSSTTGVSSPINVTGVLPATIGAGSIASVCINLAHGWDSDLDIFLRCPDGTLLELSTDNGGSGSNYTSTCFTPTAVNVIGSAGNTTPPFTGTYAPEQAFSTLNGCTANGTWELFVQDDLGGVTGTITGWTITFNNTYPPFVWSPTTAMTGANTLTPSVCPTTTTTYTLTAYGAGGCVVTDTVLVTVTPGPSLTLTSAAATTNQSVCANSAITNITYSVTGGATGATVVGLPAGVTGSYLAGVFTISGTPTTPGTYNYTVTTSGGGCIAATATGVINVNNAPVLTSITSTTPVCSGNNAVYNLTGTPNAIITYNINGGTSQTITLSAAGTATVTVPSIVANTTLNAINVAAAGTSVIGNGLSATGGINPTNATGAISALGAAATATNCSTIDNANNTQTITLQHLVPAGTIITISIARDNNQGSVNISDGTTNIGAFSAGPNDVLQQITVTTTVATNTIVITRVNGSTWIDGVQYTITLPGCSNAIALSNTVVVSSLNTIAAGTNQTVCINSAITNITLATTGATGATFTGLPAGVTGSWAGNVVTISGTPTASGTFNYTVTTTGGCPPATATGTITVTPLNTIAAGTNQTVCINSAITNITLATTGATGATFTGLPAGVTGSWAGNVVTISGTPTASGTFNYTVTTTGGCPPATATGTITVTPLNTIAAGTSQTVCINSAITNITLATTGATGATFTGLPAGVTGSWAGNVVTISGTPTASGTFNYTVTTTGGCPPATATGTITVTPLNTIAAGTNQTVCVNSAITNITLATTGATGATFTGLPAGVTGSWAGNVVTISGTPTASGTFNYTVTTTGGCPPATATGTITVTPLNTIAAGTNQTVCVNSAITNITLATTGATGATFTGLPAGVTGSWAGNVVTISGTPTASGTFNYTVTTTGGCPPATATGTITVTPLNTIAAGTNQTVCVNSAITNITLATTGATGATFTGLPAGVTGSWAGNVVTISGTPTASGTFNYTVTTTGGCPPATATGTITVTPLNTIAAGTSQTVCINSAITNITLATTGATGATFTGLPAGVTGSWAGNVVTISGTPTASGTFNYTVTTTGGCPPATATGTITVTPLNTIAAGTSQTVCINSAITNITLATTGATGATFTGLPAGVTGSWAGNVVTISGTPTASGTFNYTVTTTGGCPPATATGTITVTPLNTIAAGTNQTVCVNSAITNITLATTGATGATFTGLPAGVTGSWAGNVVTISGTPTASGTFNYTVTTTGGCPPATATGTITVTPLNTIAAGTSQTVCINSAITNITLATTGATGATFTGLPAGVTGSWAGNVVTISGTPTASGTFNYTVTTTGGCPPATATGTITVTPLNTIAAGTSQTVCINSAITNITLATTGATGATFTGLPAGVTGSWAGNVVTISGTPTASGTFNYTVTTTGGCPPATATGTLTVNPTAVPVTGFSYSTPVCINGTNPIPSTVVGFTTGGVYSSSPGLSINSTTGEIDLSLSIAGTYTITYFYGATVCGAAGSSTFNITITPLPVITLTSTVSTTTQTVCINSAITNITYSVTNATGATVSGLPAGVTGSFAAGVFTVSGTPTASGTFNYTVTTTGGCSPAATATGTITVTPLNTIAAGTNQTVCVNSAITNITLATTGATGATFTGLPAGVTGSWAGNVVTISGTPTASGTFNYTVTTTGGCPPATATGTITVTPLNTIAAGTNQTVCVNSAITNITLATTGATGATFTGLPAGVTGSWAGNVVTISGTPTASGTFNYTVTTTGGCPPATATGTITVTPLNTIAAGTNQTVCVNSAITNITLATTGATGATFTGLPAGVTGSWAGNVVTISGTPTASGTFNYTVTTTGGCPPATATGTITVTPLNTIAAGTNQTVCVNSAITNITLATTGATGATFTGLPAGVTGSWAGNVVTISGTPTASGTFNYTVTTTGGCPPATATGTITVTPLNTIAAGTNQTVCINSAVTNITLATTGATGATFTGLPAGVTGSWAGNVVTISGTPTASGTFNYTVTTTGGCPPATATGTITVTPLNTIAAGTSQTVCINSAITNITLATTGATGAAFTGLPAGVTGSWAGNVVTISGTPTASGTFNYTVTTTGGCPPATATGTITVTPLNTIAAGTNQTVCVNSAITNITLATTGATGATFTGLPAGVTGSWAGNVVTISGTPTASGTFNYTVTTTGGCPPATATGTITVTPLNTIAAGTNQTVCVNSAITNITLATTGATGATFTGLPAGVTGSWAGNVVTISGTPTASGTFNYTVTTTGGCPPATATGTITVTPLNTIAAGTNQTVCVNSAITNITLATTGATGATFTGLPAGVTGSWAGNVVTISGTPTASGTFNYTVTTTGGCPPATATGTITVTPLNTIAAGTNQTVCINSAVTNITLATTGATGATFTGLPAGVTGSWAGNVVTISGTPTASGTFNYTVTTTGGCPPATATGTITVTPLNTIAAGTSQTVCINSAITNITLATTGATGATFTGLPAGVTGSWAGNVVTISGTPTASGTFNYTVTTTGGCPPATATGTITVTPLNTIAAGTSQTVCINSAITNITLATTGATGATFTGLPAGVTGSWAANVVTISGTPTASGTFNYTVTTTGGCPPATATGTITVTPLNTIAAGTSQTVCINSAITNITLATTGATGATFTGLPAGVTGSWAGNVVTISGTPTVSGTFNYTVTTTGGCPPATATGTITVSVPNTATISYPQPQYCVSSSNVSATLSGTGNYLGSTYSASPVGLSINSTTGEINPSASNPGIYTVSYLVPASGPCASYFVSTTITITPLPTVIATNLNPTFCSGGTTNIQLSSNVPGAIFSWTVTGGNVLGAAGGTGNSINQLLTVSPGTTTTVEVIYTVIAEANGCAGTPTQIRVQVNPIPDVIIASSPSPICSGETTNISFTGTIPGTVFSWVITNITGLAGASNGTGTSIQQTLTTTGLSQGSVTYEVTPTFNGCLGTPQTVTILVNPRPELFANPTHPPLCSGVLPTNIFVSSFNAGTIFNWTVNAVGVDGATAGSAPGPTYTIIQNLTTSVDNVAGYVDYTITPTAAGCSGTPIVVRVYVNPLPKPVLTDGAICVDEFGVPFQSYTLDSGLDNATYDFVWYFNGVAIPNSNNATYTANAVGTYGVIATNSITNCVSSDVTTMVTANVTSVTPAASMTVTQSAYFSGNATLTVNVTGGSGTLMYSLDEGTLQSSNVFTNVSAGPHTITVVDTQGCTYLTYTLLVIDYPHYFTPNGDGINDGWFIAGLQNTDYIYIFDRYGKLIKQLRGEEFWDGTYNQENLPSTDYWFTVDYLENGAKKQFKAHFSLKR